jgi:hypothetical protein
MFLVLTRFRELCSVFICRTKIRGQFQSTGSHMVGTAAPSGTAATYLIPLCRFIPSKVPCTSARMTQLDTIMWDQSNNPQEQCSRARRQGRLYHLGSAEPPVRPHHLGRPHLPKLAKRAKRPRSLKETLLRMILPKEQVWFNPEDKISLTSIHEPTK